MKNKLIILSLFFSSTILTKKNKPLLETLNVLTMQKEQRRKHSVMPIHDVIKHINQHDMVPHQSHIEIDKELYAIHRGIQIKPTDCVVALFSRGYAKTNTFGKNGNFLMRGACALSAYLQFKDNIVTGIPLISFDYDDSKKGFSFGQDNAIAAIETVYNAILQANPSIKIILIGDCRGGKVALEFLTKKPPNIAAVVLMAPFTSARDLTDKIAENHLNYMPLSRPILHTFFRLYFPRYKVKKDTLPQRLHLIDPSLPIIIAHRESDTLVSTPSITNLITSLKANGNKNVHALIVQDTSQEHSMLTGNKEIQKAINRFLYKYELPHHPDFV